MGGMALFASVSNTICSVLGVCCGLGLVCLGGTTTRCAEINQEAAQVRITDGAERLVWEPSLACVPADCDEIKTLLIGLFCWPVLHGRTYHQANLAKDWCDGACIGFAILWAAQLSTFWFFWPASICTGCLLGRRRTKLEVCRLPLHVAPRRL